MIRSSKPKLSLSMPSTKGPALSININVSLSTPTHFSPRSPLVASASSPYSSAAVTPLTQAARNAVLNQRGFGTTLQVPSFSYANSHAADKSILKRDIGVRAAMPATMSSNDNKSIRFNEVTRVECVSPLPAECYGDYATMTREERRWKRRD